MTAGKSAGIQFGQESADALLPSAAPQWPVQSAPDPGAVLVRRTLSDECERDAGRVHAALGAQQCLAHRLAADRSQLPATFTGHGGLLTRH